MLFQIVVTAVILLIAVNVFLNLRYLKKPYTGINLNGEEPFVSVLIPARNEHLNIEKCVRSLQKQEYCNFEILVLDDNSSDDTGSIVSGLAAADSRITLINGDPLPPDWAGKPHACYQLAGRAKGDWLLFVDADTSFDSAMLKSVMNIAVLKNPALLSGFPRQLTSGIPHITVIPLMYFVLLSFTPLWFLSKFSKPKPAVAIGQFLLFKKEAYWGIGGHAAVKSKIIEDVWLGVEICRRGGRHLAIDLSNIVSCNMYRSMGDMWEGWVKWMYSVFVLSPVALIGILIIAYTLFLSPYLLLYHELFMLPEPSPWRLLLILQVLIIVCMRITVDIKFRESVLSGIMNPFGFAYLVLAAVFTMVRQLVGRGVRWKDRVYSQKSGIQ